MDSVELFAISGSRLKQSKKTNAKRWGAESPIAGSADQRHKIHLHSFVQQAVAKLNR
jgi:hypothetical protein